MWTYTNTWSEDLEFVYVVTKACNCKCSGCNE